MAVENACNADEADVQCLMASPTVVEPQTGTDHGGDTTRRSIRGQIRYLGRAVADLWNKWKRNSPDENMNTKTGQNSSSAPNTGKVHESISWPQGVNRKTMMSKADVYWKIDFLNLVTDCAIIIQGRVVISTHLDS